jgi:hypothetical protein
MWFGTCTQKIRPVLFKLSQDRPLFLTVLYKVDVPMLLSTTSLFKGRRFMLSERVLFVAYSTLGKLVKRLWRDILAQNSNPLRLRKMHCII